MFRMNENVSIATLTACVTSVTNMKVKKVWEIVKTLFWLKQNKKRPPDVAIGRRLSILRSESAEGGRATKNPSLFYWERDSSLRSECTLTSTE